MREKLRIGRYDYAGFSAFAAYAMCSMAIPLTIVEIGKSLNFPLDKGGMGAGGGLHLIRSTAMVVALLLCGLMTGRFGKRRTMGIAMLLMGTGIFFCAFSPVYMFLIPFLLIAGFGEGICEGAATPFVQDLHKDAPERYVNIAHSMWSVGIAICVILAGGLLSLDVNWRVIPVCCGILAIICCGLFLWKENPLKKYPEETVHQNASDIWRYSVAIAKSPRFWLYCFGMFTGAGAEFCITFWAAAYLRLNFQASALIAGLGTGAIAAGMFLGRMMVGYYAKMKYLKHILLTFSIATIPLSLLLILLTPASFPSPGILFSVLLAILFLCGIGISPYWPTLQVYGVNQLPELDSTMLYIYFSAAGIPGCGFYTWLIGILGDRFGLRGAFILIPCSLLLYALTIILDSRLFSGKTLPEK